MQTEVPDVDIRAVGPADDPVLVAHYLAIWSSYGTDERTMWTTPPGPSRNSLRGAAQEDTTADSWLSLAEKSPDRRCAAYCGLPIPR